MDDIEIIKLNNSNLNGSKNNCEPIHPETSTDAILHKIEDENGNIEERRLYEIIEEFKALLHNAGVVSITVNGSDVQIDNGIANIRVPTRVSDLLDKDNYATTAQLNNIEGLAALKTGLANTDAKLSDLMSYFQEEQNKTAYVINKLGDDDKVNTFSSDILNIANKYVNSNFATRTKLQETKTDLNDLKTKVDDSETRVINIEDRIGELQQLDGKVKKLILALKEFNSGILDSNDPDWDVNVDLNPNA